MAREKPSGSPQKTFAEVLGKFFEGLRESLAGGDKLVGFSTPIMQEARARAEAAALGGRDAERRGAWPRA